MWLGLERDPRNWANRMTARNTPGMGEKGKGIMRADAAVHELRSNREKRNSDENSSDQNDGREYRRVLFGLL